jgi:hypothetical protein
MPKQQKRLATSRLGDRNVANIFLQCSSSTGFITSCIYRRLLEKEMEMIWNVGSGSSKQQIFTGALYHTYSPPPGISFLIMTIYYCIILFFHNIF